MAANIGVCSKLHTFKVGHCVIQNWPPGRKQASAYACAGICSITPSPHPITKSCRNAVAFAALSRRETTEDNLMPFLFWMPMIVMCGLWRAAQEDAQSLIPPPR
jgi:hypothetical protein